MRTISYSLSVFVRIRQAIDSTNQASVALYIICGFHYSGTITKAGYKFENWLDLAFYQLDLKDPSNPTNE